MNSETLTGITTRDMTLHAGQHPKFVPAGTAVTVRTEAVESGRAFVYARVVGHPRIAGVVNLNAIVPA